MAKTYYKYKERGGIVDYAAISKDFSTGISGIIGDIEQGADELTEDILKAQEGVKADVEKEIRAKEAEKARARAEAAAREAKVAAASKTDFNPEMSKEKEANDKFIQAAIQAQNKALDFKRQRDSQQISDSEYLQKMGALEKTFTIMKQASVAVNDMANRTYSGLEDGTVDPVQQLALKEVLSYNFTDPNIRFEIGEDGYGVVYRVDKEGNVVENTRRPVDFIKNLAIQDFKSYDVNQETSELVGMIGKTIETYRGQGMTNEDLLKKQGIMPSIYGGPDITPMYLIDEYAEGLDDNQLASVMTNVLGSKYKPTFNPEEHVKVDDEGNFYVDEMKILYTDSDPALGLNNRVAQLTESQRSKAIEYVKSLILTQFNVKPADTTSGKAPSSAQIQAGKARDKAVVSINTLADWYGAKTPEDRRTAAAGLAASLGTNFISLVPSPDGKTATLTSIQKVSGKDVQVDTDIAIEGVPFDQFIKSFGKALTGQDLSQYYSDFVASGRTVNFEPIDLNIDYPAGAYKKTFKQPPKDLSQELADVGAWRTNVVKTIDDIKVSEGFFGVSEDAVNESFESAISDNLFAAGISDFMVSRTGNAIKIEVDGLGEISVAVGRKDSDKAKVKKILSDVYTRVSKGEKIDGSGKPDGDDELIDASKY
jgi:hypothetical protein